MLKLLKYRVHNLLASRLSKKELTTIAPSIIAVLYEYKDDPAQLELVRKTVELLTVGK